MKKVLSALALLLGSLAFVNAQPSPASNPVESNDQLVLADQTILTGTITDNIRKKGEVVLLVNGKKTRLKADGISSLRIANAKYITGSYTFYEVIYETNSFSLLRKASEPAGVQYNGSEAVVVSSPGDIDDLFLKTQAGQQLLSKKNISEELGKVCPGIVIEKFEMEVIKNALAKCEVGK